MIDDRFLPRVWTDKGYYYPIFSELGITYENKNLPFTKENIKDIDWAFRWHFNHSDENVDMEYINTLEQCTGLKDKNGKLIYENDLIKIDDDVAVINWSDYYARFMLESSEDIFDFERSYAEECEVIGNIHENADLIKVGGE
jgi:hypothetical protein